MDIQLDEVCKLLGERDLLIHQQAKQIAELRETLAKALQARVEGALA